MRRHETPLRRVNPSGKVVWVARWTGRDGKRRNGWPPEIPGTHDLKRDAQTAIDACYDREATDGPALRQIGTVESYVKHWTRVHPRSLHTARTYAANLRAALDVRVGGVPFRAWHMAEVERSEIAELLHHLLTVDGRAANGARGVLRTVSAMWEDAISDGWAKHNPVAGIRVRQSDPRVVKRKREPHVYSWEQMHALAASAPTVQGRAMIRVLSDCGLRLGEMLALERADVDPEWLWVRQTAHDGVVTAGTKTTRDCPEKARRVPLAPGLRLLLSGLPPRLDTRLLFPAQMGNVLQQRRFYATVWRPARKAAGLPEALPHDLRHSFVTLMRAAGVDPADLAEATGHTVTTATGVYTHATGASWEAMREAAG